SEEEVERNNRQFFPISNSSMLVKAKIRVINPDKKVIELDESKILTAVDENTNHHFKYFALEGLEPGSIIDYYYVVQKRPDYTGSRRFFQDEYKIKKFEFDLYCSDHLKFEFKTYNDSTKVSFDSIDNEKVRYSYHIESINPLKEEEQALYTVLLKQFVFKLSKNLSSGANDFSSFKLVSDNLHSRYFAKADKKGMKSLDKFLKDVKISDEMAADEKIRTIENHVKSNINIVENPDPQFDAIASIIKLKSASEMGITRLLMLSFMHFNIDVQLVFTCDRTSRIFDKEFESYHVLTDILLYFPETDKYTAPDKFEYRYGVIPEEFTNTNGLFIEEKVVNGYKRGEGKVRFIEPLPYSMSYVNHDVVATIDPDFESVTIDNTNSYMGYYATYTQPYFNLFNDEFKEQFIRDVVLHGFEEQAEIIEWSVENDDANLVGKEPFIQKTKIKVNNMIDKAGNKYLFKVGLLIGPQVELYSEEERRLPVSDNYKRMFDRNLVIHIPEGYKVNNVEDLKVYADYVKDDKTILLFDTQYTIDGQTITVKLHEFYDQVDYTLDEYPAYRKVVNSASDFNKVVLVIEKE
ncbi:MAG: DUF3857 domain-containing protein, partial [Bacteroidales bacterium]|nr:DUF3857 domain-containing protein [Bacteroidales bacterium]